MELLKTIAEGGQIWAHRMRMARQVLRIAIMLSITIGTVFFAYKMYKIPKTHFQSIWYYGKAKTIGFLGEKVAVDSEFLLKVEHKKYKEKNVLVKGDRLEKLCKKPFDQFWKQTQKNLIDSFAILLKVFCGSVIFFLGKGMMSRKKKHIEGQRQESAFKMAVHLHLKRKASPIKLGILPLVKGTETRHILLSGGTGSGKTNCFHHLLPQIRKLGQRAVIVDTTGEFVSKYYREGKDIILNPFDKRGSPWHPWAECRDSYDYDAMAQSFIPSSYNDSENFWRVTAQEVFCSILNMKSSEKKITEVSKLILYDPIQNLYVALKGSKASPFLDPSSERTSGSIRAVASSYLRSLELLKDTDDPFSIRDWVQNGSDDSWLFLTSTVGQRVSLVPLLSAWFSIAMRSLIQMSPDLKRRLWFVSDELPALNRLKDLETCLTESRKFGGCSILAIQSPSQLEMIYGKDLTRVIMGNCATRVAFSEQDPEIAARISRTFGEKEIKEFQEAISYGAHEMRDGVNLSFQSKTSPVVSSTSIQSLEINQAFVKLPGNFPITKIKLKYLNR